MDFLLLMNILLYAGLGLFFIGGVLLICSVESQEDWMLVLGSCLLVMSVFAVVAVRFLPDIMNKEQVRVEDVSDATGSSYVRVVVPKEDEDRIRSKDSSVVELKMYYNENYDNDQYIDEEDVIELYIDLSSGYTVTDKDITK